MLFCIWCGIGFCKIVSGSHDARLNLYRNIVCATVCIQMTRLSLKCRNRNFNGWWICLISQGGLDVSKQEGERIWRAVCFIICNFVRFYAFTQYEWHFAYFFFPYSFQIRNEKFFCLLTFREAIMLQRDFHVTFAKTLNEDSVCKRFSQCLVLIPHWFYKTKVRPRSSKCCISCL